MLRRVQQDPPISKNNYCNEIRYEVKVGNVSHQVIA